MEMSRYSIKPNAGKGLSGFITNLNVADGFDPAWLDSNAVPSMRKRKPTESATQHGWIQTFSFRFGIGRTYKSATQHGWIQTPIFWVLIYRFKPMRNFGSSADQPKL